jgi:hypothetical protein
VASVVDMAKGSSTPLRYVQRAAIDNLDEATQMSGLIRQPK